MSAITINSLTKRYAGTKVKALDKLSLTVNSGTLYGFVGPNGAGKSTTIRTLLNFIQPTSGSAKILDLDVVNDSLAIRRRIGYLAGDFTAYDKMTGGQLLDYLNGLHPPKDKSYVKRLVQDFKVELDKPISTLSKGNRQKLGVIQAVMHQPELLILDEPTSGLDPLMQETFYDLIKDFKRRGATVFLSSHNLAEVQKTCDRIGIIRDGKLIHESSIMDLRTAASQTFDIWFEGKPPIAELKKLPQIKQIIPQDDNGVTLHVSGKLTPLFAILSKHEVSRFSGRELDLEASFLQYYGEKHDTDNKD